MNKMETKIHTDKGHIDFKSLDDNDLKNGMYLTIYACLEDLINYSNEDEKYDGKIFGIFLSTIDEKKNIMADIGIDELELFANSLTKMIELVRKNYGQHIKKQNDMGCFV